MLPLSGPFASALAANRSRFNAKFAEARRFRPQLEAGAFKDHLAAVLAPIADRVAEVDAGRVEAVTEALFDLSLDLVGQEFLGPGARYPAIVEGWSILLPALPQRVAEAPRLFAGAVTNALYNLSLSPGARPQAWQADVIALSALCRDVPELLEAAKVAAWRAGLAHYRQGALDLAGRLDPRVACAALGLADRPGLPLPRSETELGALLDTLLAEPWLTPQAALQPRAGDRRLRIVARLGGFRGFGGPFVAPPMVASEAAGNFVVSDGDQHWLLTADCFGATLHRMDGGSTPAKSQPCTHFQLDPTGRVSKFAHSQSFPELARFSSAADHRATLAVTTPLSHSVYLVALAEAPPA